MPLGNVLFITLDQYRGDCIGALGHPVVETPNLDRLVHDGVSFTRHVANTAPCGPSRATLYTGLYAMNHRSVGNGTPLDARLTNIALEARALGYDPALFGYTDTSVDPRTVATDDPRLLSYEGVLPGFDPVLDFPSDPLTPWLPWLAARGYEIPDEPQRIYEPQDVAIPAGRGETWRPARYAAEHTESAFLTEHLLTWLGEQDGPWFAHASYLRPHPPYLVPEPWNDRYDPADVPPAVGCATREEEMAIHPIAKRAIRFVGAAEHELDRRQLAATYFGMIGEVDHQVGRVLDHLEAAGTLDDTLVVLTSDHGELLNDHWLTEKLGWWPEAYRVPLIIRDPAAPTEARGRRVEATTEHVDVAPTVLEWMGGDVPASWDGRSLLPFLAAEPTTPERWRTDAHWQWDFRDPVTQTYEHRIGATTDEMSMDVLMGERWLYVHVAARDLPDLLFDLDEDPHLTRDRATDPTCATTLADCRGELLSWRMRHDDRTLTNQLVTPMGLIDTRVPRVG
jgi:arylsulfatase A-like enzyme